MTKKIIHVLVQQCPNFPQTHTSNFWGFADIARGTLACMQAAKQLELSFWVDLRHHPVSQALEVVPLPEDIQKEVDEKKDMIPFVPNHQSIRSFLDNKTGLVLCLTNSQLVGPMDDEVRTFFTQTFRPNANCQEKIDAALETIGGPFRVMHFRLGDAYLVHGQTNAHVFSHFYETYLAPCTERTVCMSDSAAFREFVAQKGHPHIKMVEGTPTHVGRSSDVMFTMTELFVMSRATHLHSVGLAGSALATLVHSIWKIPFQRTWHGPAHIEQYACDATDCTCFWPMK